MAVSLATKKAGASIVVVPLAVLMVFAPWMVSSGSPVTALLLAGQLAVCSVGVVRSYSQGTRPVSLVYFMFSFAWLGIGPTYQLSHGQMAWGDFTILADDDLVIRALSLNVLASSMFLLGSEAQRWRKSVTFPQVQTRGDGRILWIYLAAATLLAPIAIQASGGLGNMFDSRSARSAALASGGVSIAQSGGLQVALVTILPAALSIAGAVLAGVRFCQRWKLRHVRLTDAAAVITALALLVLYCNPLANTRFVSVMAFGSLVLVMLRPRSIQAGRWFAVLALLGTAVVYPLADIFRHGFDATTSLDTGIRAFASNDFDGFQQIANALLLADSQGLTWGHYTASALLYFVPRSLWAGKATPASLDVAANRGYSFTNLSLPFPAEMYIEFGILGVGIILFALGLLCSKTDQAWLEDGLTKMGVLAPVMALAMLGFIRGPLGSLAPIYLTAILLVFVGLTRQQSTQSSRPAKLF